MHFIRFNLHQETLCQLSCDSEPDGALPVQAGMRPVVSSGEVPWKSLCVVKRACGLLVIIS